MATCTWLRISEFLSSSGEYIFTLCRIWYESIYKNSSYLNGKSFPYIILEPNVFLKTLTFFPQHRSQIPNEFKVHKISESYIWVIVVNSYKCQNENKWIKNCLGNPLYNNFSPCINCICKLVIHSLLYLFPIQNFIHDIWGRWVVQTIWIVASILFSDF